MSAYRSISWEEFYEKAPDVDREEVDHLFRRLTNAIEMGNVPQSQTHSEEIDDNGLEYGDGVERAVLHCDGASSGNPGPAGVGMVLTDLDGTEFQAWGIPIGKATNNVAEYRALIAGLQRALKINVKSIKVLSDSQLMVRQLNGDYRVKSSNLKPLYRRAKKLFQQFDEWSIEHVDRELNSRADEIAKKQVKRAKNAGA